MEGHRRYQEKKARESGIREGARSLDEDGLERGVVEIEEEGKDDGEVEIEKGKEMKVVARSIGGMSI